LKEILENRDSEEEQASYLKQEGIIALKRSHEENLYMNIPSNWFLSDRGEKQEWSGIVEMTRTQNSNFLGILNK